MTAKKDPALFKCAATKERFGPLTITCPCGTVMHRAKYPPNEWVRRKYCSNACSLKHHTLRYSRGLL